MKTQYLAMSLFVGALLLYSCKNDNFEEMHPNQPEVCDTTGPITFDVELQPIFAQGCGSNDVNCHAPGALQVNLTDYDETHDAGVNDELLGSILHLPGYNPMPNDGRPFSACNIQAIQAWVNRDYPKQ